MCRPDSFSRLAESMTLVIPADSEISLYRKNKAKEGWDGRKKMAFLQETGKEGRERRRVEVDEKKEQELERDRV